MQPDFEAPALNRVQQFSRFIHAYPGRAGSVAGWFQQLCGALSALALMPLMVSRLGLKDAGIWFSLNGVVQIAGLTDMGLTIVFSRQIAYSLGSSDHDEPPKGFLKNLSGWAGVSQVYFTAKRYFTFIGTAAFGVLALIWLFVLPHTKLSLEGMEGGIVLWIGLSTTLVLTLALKPGIALLEGTGNLVFTRILTGGAQLMNLVGMGLLLYFNFSLPALALCVCVVSLVTFWAQHSLITTLVPQLGRVSGPKLGPALVFEAIPLGAVNVGAFAMMQVQVPLVGLSIGATAVPAFYAAQRLSQFLSIACMQTVFPQLPLFTQQIGAKAFRQAARRMLRSVKIASLGAILVASGFYFFGNEVVSILAQGHQLPVLVLGLMALDLGLACASVAWGHFVIASGKTSFAYVNLFGGILNVVFLFFLIKPWQILAFPSASMAAGLFTSYTCCWIFGWKLLKTLSARS